MSFITFIHRILQEHPPNNQLPIKINRDNPTRPKKICKIIYPHPRPAPTAPETASSSFPELIKPIIPPIAATIIITQNHVIVLNFNLL